MIHALTFAAYTVTLDGKTVLPRTQAAVLAGHVLLPIRTLGDALGADIGYDGPSHVVTVQRGSHVARVHLNCPQCIVHGHAFVPLRDVATAFGLDVAYDAPSRVVALSGGAANGPVARDVPPGYVPPPSYAQPTSYTVTLQPASGTDVHDPYPAISARFAGAVSIDPSSLRVTVDGRDVTAESAVIGDQVLFTPRRALAPGSHDVAVSGRDTTGVPLAQQWSFTDSFDFAPAAPPAPYPIDAIWIDRWIVPGTYAFDVYVAGAPGITGYVGVDGIGGFFPLIVNSARSYVAHVIVPPGLYQPNARVAARITLPNGQLQTIVLPQRITLYTKPLAPGAPYATATPVPGVRRVPPIRSTVVPTPTPAPGTSAPPPVRRIERATPTPAPTPARTAVPTPVATPSPVPTPRATRTPAAPVTRTAPPLVRTAAPAPATTAPVVTPSPSPKPTPVRTRKPVIRRTAPPSPEPQ